MTKRCLALFTTIVGCSILLPHIAKADTYTARTYNGGDSRGYTSESPSDWASGMWKAECANNERILGVSGTSDHSSGADGAFGQAVLCDAGTVKTDATQYSTRSLTGAGDDRADTGTSDWDVNFKKAECGTDEVVSGISQTSLGTTRLVSSLLCRKIICNNGTNGNRYTSTESQCNTVVYSYPDNRLSYTDGDWSSGYMKNQCGDTQLLKGATVNSDGTIHALLCCNYATTICL